MHRGSRRQEVDGASSKRHPWTVYGVPDDLDLSPFVGGQLTQVGLGEFTTQFSFVLEPHRTGEVGAQGRWEVVTAEGRSIGGRNPSTDSPDAPTPFGVLLGSHVEGFSLSPPVSFDVHLSCGLTLRFFDDDDHYESITVHPGGYVI